MFCTKCGAENPDNGAFCTSCGEAFGEVTETAEVVEAPVTEAPVAEETAEVVEVTETVAAEEVIEEAPVSSEAPVTPEAASPFAAAMAMKNNFDIKKYLPILAGAVAVVLILIILFGVIFGRNGASSPKGLAKKFVKASISYNVNAMIKCMDKDDIEGANNKAKKDGETSLKAQLKELVKEAKKDDDFKDELKKAKKSKYTYGEPDYSDDKQTATVKVTVKDPDGEKTEMKVSCKKVRGRWYINSSSLF